MSNRRSLSWSAALRDLRADRAALPEVRETDRRAFPATADRPATTLSAWRGRSGARHTFTVRPLSAAALLDADRCVALAVAPGPDGAPRILRATADVIPESAAAWIDSVRRAGATELLVLRFGTAEAERTAIVVDLTAAHRVAGLAA